MVDSEVPHSHVIVETEIRNEGVPYADSFCLLSRFCLIQTGPTTCHLKITAEVKFVKSIIGFMKCKKKKKKKRRQWWWSRHPFSFDFERTRMTHCRCGGGGGVFVLFLLLLSFVAKHRPLMVSYLLSSTSRRTNESNSKREREKDKEESRRLSLSPIMSKSLEMKKLKFSKSLTRFIKCHLLCARSAMIEKNTISSLQESLNDLGKIFFLLSSSLFDLSLLT